MISSIKTYCIKNPVQRIRQGDILRKILVPEVGISMGGENPPVEFIEYAYGIILTQDCDLEQDHTNKLELEKNPDFYEDKILASVLICPAFPTESLREGTHLKELKIKKPTLNSSIWNSIKINQHPRYHFMNAEPDCNVPELVVDFKHFHTVTREFVYTRYSSQYLATVNELFRESLSQRFCNYISRIGLPTVGNGIGPVQTQ
jgi:hypothetical protein